jgi:hypothetical protein
MARAKQSCLQQHDALAFCVCVCVCVYVCVQASFFCLSSRRGTAAQSAGWLALLEGCRNWLALPTCIRGCHLLPQTHLPWRADTPP